MIMGFKNYAIGKGRVIIALEKDIYNQAMIKKAGLAITNECKLTVTIKRGSYEIILTPKKGVSNLEHLAITFNDALINSVALYSSI